MVNERFEKMRGELRRGTLILAVLLALREEEYGYSLRGKMQDVGLDIEESTLYPLIRRLETQGLLSSHWSETDGGRKRRYYKTSEAGLRILEDLLSELESINTSIEQLNTPSS
ncbi:MAG: PadR family transcriptional regulator [Opitutales bacterium]|nr:PadR family transcriptional regulator [Opitutales bacterium]